MTQFEYLWHSVYKQSPSPVPISLQEFKFWKGLLSGTSLNVVFLLHC